MTAGPYQRISARLHPGERLIWCGRPRTGIHFRRNQIPGALVLVVFMAIFIGIPLLIMISSIRQGEIGGVVVASLFLLVVLYATAGRYIMDYRRQGRAAYGLTDRRVIVLGDWKDFRNWSLPLASLSEITLRERKDGAGSIVCFSSEPGWNRPTKRKGVLPRPLVVSIVDVRHVHNLLLDARSRAAHPPDARGVERDARHWGRAD